MLRGAGQLVVEAIAALSQLALEMQPRQVRRDARQHFLALDRLGDVVDRAELETRDLVRHFAARRQEDHDGVARLGLRPSARGTPRSRPCPASSRRAASGPAAPACAMSSAVGAVAGREDAMTARRCSVRTRTCRLVGLSSTTRIVDGGRAISGRALSRIGASARVERRGQRAHAVEIEVGRERARSGGRARHRVVAGGQRARRSRADRRCAPIATASRSRARERGVTRRRRRSRRSPPAPRDRPLTNSHAEVRLQRSRRATRRAPASTGSPRTRRRAAA